MESASDPLYIYYNGPANLQELEGVNLAGARIFLNGSYSLRDLRNVNFRGATVFMNGQQTSSPVSPRLRSRSRSPPRQHSPERRHSDYYRPQDNLYRPGRDSRWPGPRHGRGARERKRCRAEDGSEREYLDRLQQTSSPFAVQPLTDKPSPDSVRPEPGRLSPYEDSDTRFSETATMTGAAGGYLMHAESNQAVQRSESVRSEFVEGLTRYARETQDERSAETEPQSHKEATRLSLIQPTQTAKRTRVESASDSGLIKKANSLTSEELNLRLRKRALANMARSSQNENAKSKQMLAERQQVKSQLLHKSVGEENGTSQLLPQDSPLNNIMNFARIEEEIVQTKIQYAMAEKQLRSERKALGRASDAIIQRVKAMGKALAELHERRDATQADKSRIEAFRRQNSTMKSERPTTQSVPVPSVDLVLSDPTPSLEDGEIRDGHGRTPAQQIQTGSTNPVQKGTTPDSMSGSHHVRFTSAGVEAFIHP